jgi:hypothetical protein
MRWISRVFGVFLIFLLSSLSINGQIKITDLSQKNNSISTYGPFARTNKGQFNGVVRAGIVSSHIRNDDFGGWNKLGFTGGVGTFTQLNRNWKAQLEVNYAMRGSRKRPTKTDPGIYRIEPHYIDIPILFKTNFWIFEGEIGINNGVYLFHLEADESGRLFEDQYGWSFHRYEIAGLAGLSVPLVGNWVGNVRLHHSILPAAGRSFTFVGGRFISGGALNMAMSFSFNRLLFPKD